MRQRTSELEAFHTNLLLLKVIVRRSPHTTLHEKTVKLHVAMTAIQSKLLRIQDKFQTGSQAATNARINAVSHWSV